MATIKVRVRGEIATNLTPEVRLVCQNDKYDVEFEFDDSWANSNFKTALFIYNGQLIAIPFDGTICKIPALYETELLHIGVKSNDVVGLHTTTPAKVVYLLSANDLTSNKIPEPSKDVYDEIIALLNKYISGGGGGSSGGGLTEEQVREIVAEETDGLVAESERDEFVKGGLTEPEETWTETNKAKACETIGALPKKTTGTQTTNLVQLDGGLVPWAYNTLGNSIVRRLGNGSAQVKMADNPTDNDIVNVGYVDGKADALSSEIAVINVALEQSGLVKKYKQPIEQEYSERVTADGANVLDGSKAVLKKVVGNMVKSQNLFDGTLIKGYFGNADFAITDGTSKIYRSLKINLPSGTYKIQFSSETQLMRKIANGMYESNPVSVFTTNGGEVGFSFRAIDNTDWKDEYLVWITEGEIDKPYTPYFTGLKSASFGGIESKNADGTETAMLAFQKTETPLGTTIDFEQKKITDYGVDLVLTGTERIDYYKYQAYNGIMSSGICQAGNKQVADYVSTDSDRGTDSGFTSGRMWCGYAGSTNFFWIGILDILGFTTQGTEPTAEEKATAIANFKAWLAERYTMGNPVTIRYVSSTLQSETDFTADNEYTAYKGGTEKVLENDGNEYGADNTLTQDYILVTAVE